MTDQALELSIIKQMITANNPLPKVPFDIAVNEDGVWTLIVYRNDLLDYPAARTVSYMRWLQGRVIEAWQKYNISIKVERL